MRSGVCSPPWVVRTNRQVLNRDLSFFLVVYLVAYGIYVYRTMESEGDLEGQMRSPYFHYNASSPHLRFIILQLVAAGSALVSGSLVWLRLRLTGGPGVGSLLLGGLFCVAFVAIILSETI